MLERIIYIAICISLFYSMEAFADAVYLKNGNRVSGIITGENEDSVQIKINVGATVTFSKEDIEKIERESSEEHSRIKDVWDAERTRREAEEIRRDAFEKEQRKKGLVEYEGKWLTPEEREKLYVASIAKGLDKRHTKRRFSYNKDRRNRSSFASMLLDKGNWFVRETEHFSIFYRDPDQAKIISDKAEYYFEKIAYDLGYEKEIKWKKKCQVYIIEDLDKWRDFLKDIGFNPELIGGFVPNYDEKEMFLCALSEAYLALIFPHELTHLIFAHIAGTSTIPLWLNEGLANYEASVTSILNDILVKNIKEGRHILLGDLLRMTGYPEGKEKRELFYAQAEKLVEFLITQYGREKFRDFCDLILKDRSFRESLFGAYKGDFEDLEDFNIKLVEYIVK
jgi:hypothetical protein